MDKNILEALNRLEDKIDNRIDKLEKKVDKLNDNLTKFKVNAMFMMGGLLTAWEAVKKKIGLWVLK